jgi:hypothetical protein
MTSEGRLVLTPNMVRVPIALIAIGAVAAVIGLFVNSERVWLNLLIDGFYALSIGVSGIFFFTTQRLSSAKWSASIRRVPEAFMQVMPAAVILMVLLAFGFHAIYPWTHPHAVESHEPLSFTPGRVLWLTPAFVYVRMAVVLALWTFFALGIRKTSLAADASREAGLAAHRTLNRYAGVFAPLFALTIAVAAYDWLISLEPQWFSTMFSVYVFAGCFVQGIAAIALTTVILARRGNFGPKFRMIGLEPIHTLGTMILAFCTFWAYIWVCQYLLIWYGNIPEEAPYYLARTHGSWLPVFLISFLINWIIPFFALLPRGNKRSLKVMAGISILVLFGRWLDLYILVMPSHWSSFTIGPLEIAMAAGVAGLIFLLVVRALSRAPLVPTHEPIVAARRAHAHAHGGSS